MNRAQWVDRACLGKRAYMNEIDALVMARFREGRGAPELKPYRCPNCGFWHLTKTVARTFHSARSAGTA